MKKLYCIECPSGCLLTIKGFNEDTEEVAVEGNKCDTGEEFARSELVDPVRTLTTTVRTVFPEVPVLSVRTDGAIPKELIAQALDEINQVVVNTQIGIGETIIEDIAETEVRVIVTSPALTELGAELENKSAELSRAGGSNEVGTAAAGSGTGSDDEDEDYSGSYDDGGEYEGRPAVSSLEGTVLDDLGEDAVGGIVGAAGEAVGVEDGEDYDDDYDGEQSEGKGYRPKGRARIGRNR